MQREKAYNFGVEAFNRGERCVPAHDKEFLKILEGLKVGEGIPLLKAWNKGWTDKNLYRRCFYGKG